MLSRLDFLVTFLLLFYRVAVVHRHFRLVLMCYVCFYLCLFFSLSLARSFALFLSVSFPLCLHNSSISAAILKGVFSSHSFHFRVSLSLLFFGSHSIHVHFISYLITAIHICFPVAFLFHSLDFLSCFSILQLNDM